MSYKLPVEQMTDGAACTIAALFADLAAVPGFAQAAPPQRRLLRAAAAGSQRPSAVDVIGGISAPMPIAIPPMPTPASVDTAAGPTDALGRQVAEIVTADLKQFGPVHAARAGRAADRRLFRRSPRPIYRRSGRSAGAQALVQGYVRANGDGTLTVGCYLYDVAAEDASWPARASSCRRRLAPRRAQMRRHGLFAADRRGPLFRQPRRLRLGDRPQGQPHQAARDHGSRTAPTTAS